MSKAIAAPDEIIQDEYLAWIENIVHADKFDEDTRLLLAHLQLVEWYSVLPRDHAREEDGKKFRGHFIRDSEFINYDSIDGPCTFLECILGIADRMDFFCTPPEHQSEAWLYFWLLLNNAGLLGNGCDVLAIDKRVNRVLERTYSASGRGGLFPLKNTTQNQIGTEIWYQMSSYIESRPDLYEHLITDFSIDDYETDPFKILDGHRYYK